jgi:hypothetical protein
VGLETEFITDGDLQALSRTLSKFGNRIEYIVGSVHHVNGIPIDFDRETFHRCLASFSSESVSPDESQTMERFLSSYFDSQYEVLRRFHPEIVGHIDLCRLYNPQLRFADYPGAYEKLERNVKFAVDYGALFEANAAAFRKGWDAAYPGEDTIEVRRFRTATRGATNCNAVSVNLEAWGSSCAFRRQSWAACSRVELSAIGGVPPASWCTAVVVSGTMRRCECRRKECEASTSAGKLVGACFLDV